MVGRIALTTILGGLLLVACREQRPECKLDCTQFEYDNHESEDLLAMSVSVFSGRPNPVATLEQDETERVISTIAGAAVLDDPPASGTWPEYGSVRIHPIDEDAGYPDRIQVSDGRIEVREDGVTQHYEDRGRELEAYLLCTAYYKEAIDETILEWITERSW